MPLTLSPPPLPEEALPVGLRRSIDNERVASETANWTGIDCASPRSIETRNYKDLFSRLCKNLRPALLVENFEQRRKISADCPKKPSPHTRIED